MNNSIVHKGITIELQMHISPTRIPGRGFLHPAKLVGSYIRDQLSDLMGLQLWGSPVLAVESFAVNNQTDRYINLLMDVKKWGVDNNE